MKLTYLGHSCFAVESQGYRLILDPYQPDSVPGLAPLSLRADLALCSHGHRDHNAREAVQLTGAAPALQIQELHTFHDPEGGALRGENTIHVITAEGLRVAHLGDLGCWPEPELLEQLRDLDALLIPVGGYYYTCAVTPRQTAQELAALRAALEGKTFQYPLAIDVESAGLRVLAPEALAARVAEAAAQLEAWNLYAMVYTYTNFADTALAMDALTAYDLWLADYRGKCPTRPHGMWQYTSKGRVAGIDGPVDLSDAAKDYPAICKRTGLGTFQAG